MAGEVFPKLYVDGKSVHMISFLTLYTMGDSGARSVWKHHPHFHHNTYSSGRVSQTADSRGNHSAIHCALSRHHWKSMAGVGLDSSMDFLTIIIDPECGRY